MSDEKIKFPSETVELPSRGHFYDPASPLATGKIEVKYMTAREEDILTSPVLVRQGVVLDKVLQALIATPGIVYDDILLGDKNAISIAARILGYGKKYSVEVFDYSGKRQEVDVDLTELDHKKVDFSNLPKGVNEFEYTLPHTERVIKYKFLTNKDDREIEKELESLAKISGDVDHSITTRLKKVIVAVDGNSDSAHINKFVDHEFLSLDSRAFRTHLAKVTPDMDMEISITDPDGSERRVPVPMTIDFFWPSS